jgi:hypothetical protein
MKCREARHLTWVNTDNGQLNFTYEIHSSAQYNAFDKYTFTPITCSDVGVLYETVTFQNDNQEKINSNTFPKAMSNINKLYLYST